MLSDLKDVFIDQLWIDVGFRPQSIEQFVALHQAAGMLDQIVQDIEGLRRKCDRVLPVPEALLS